MPFPGFRAPINDALFRERKLSGCTLRHKVHVTRNQLELRPWPTHHNIGTYSYESAFLDVNEMSKFRGEVPEAARTPRVF